MTDGLAAARISILFNPHTKNTQRTDRHEKEPQMLSILGVLRGLVANHLPRPTR